MVFQATIARAIRAAAWCALAAGTAGCWGSPVGPLPPGGHHVLFIGNSLTYVNDLPGTLAALAASVGDTIRVRSVTSADFALIDHFNGGSDAIGAIRQGRWEYVVLQQGPSSLPLNRDTLVLAAQLFNPYVRGVGAIPALYMVWPSIDRREFFDAVRASYQAAADAVNGVFLPAGEAWLTAWAEDPDLPFYSTDGFHPSVLGTYLTALVMYERITGHDARSLPPTAIVGGFIITVPEATVRLLQRAAHETNARYE